MFTAKDYFAIGAGLGSLLQLVHELHLDAARALTVEDLPVDGENGTSRATKATASSN